MPGAAATPTDAATGQALLASRAGAGDAAGPGVISGAAATATGAAGGPVNAATTPAGAPLAPVHATTPQPAGRVAGGPGIGGLRGTGGRERDRGLSTTAGLLGAGAATATGAGTSRLGGAGTLAGLGSTARPGVAPAPTAPGTGTLTGGGPTTNPGGPAATPPPSSATTASRPGALPMPMTNAGTTGQTNNRRGHTPASYLTNATNTTDIIGDPVRVTPAVLGRQPVTTPESPPRFSESGVAAGPTEAGSKSPGHRIVGLRAMSMPRRPTNATND